jgi:hypothetical protein
MSNDKGWISIHRKITENWLWKDKPFSRAHAWIDMLIMANHTDNKFFLGPEIIEVKRGQILSSIRKLADRWGWSRMKATRFIDVLQHDQMLIKYCDNHKTILTICNYDSYQSFQNPDWDTKKPQTSHGRATKRPRSNTNNNDNNVMNENNENNNITIIQLPDSLNVPFDDFWNAYDKKVGNKEKLRRRWASLSDAQRQAAMDYIPLYLQSQPDKKFRKNPETFINNKSWTDELIFSSHGPKQKSGTSRISRSFVEEVYSGLPPELRPG